MPKVVYIVPTNEEDRFRKVLTEAFRTANGYDVTPDSLQRREDCETLSIDGKAYKGVEVSEPVYIEVDAQLLSQSLGSDVLVWRKSNPNRMFCNGVKFIR
jgi:hypothetical protein